MKNIILCGFMGCGKSTVGKLLAKKLGMTFVDMDAYIEEKAGMTVKEIFAGFGESHFRDLEHQACIDLNATGNKVIGAGGGTLTFDRNTKVLKENGTVVFLEVSYEILCERLKNDTARPLLHCENRNEKIKELLEARTPIYKSVADITINGNLVPNKVVPEIIVESREPRPNN